MSCHLPDINLCHTCAASTCNEFPLHTATALNLCASHLTGVLGCSGTVLQMAGKIYLEIAQALEAIVGSQALHQKGSSLGKGPARRHLQQLHTTSTVKC